MECEKIQKNSSDYFELVVEQDEDIQLCSLITVLLDHYARKKNEEEQADCPTDDAYNLGFLNNIHCSILYPQEKQPRIKMNEVNDLKIERVQLLIFDCCTLFFSVLNCKVLFTYFFMLYVDRAS